MSKRTEIVKSIVLTVLVAMSIVLFANSWVREWSFSDGENDSFLGRIADSLGLGHFFETESETVSGTDVIAPNSVILTSGTKRIILNKGTDMYSDNYGDILSIFLSLDRYSGEAEEIDAGQWYYVQKNQAIFLDYGADFKREIVETATGCKLPAVIENISEVILASNDSATNKLVVYVHDGTNEKYYKMVTSDSAGVIKNKLSDFKGYKNIPLAAELGFNVTPEQGFGQQTVIYGNTLINLEVEKVKIPKLVGLKTSVSSMDNSVLNGLLSLFGMSKSSAKQYADKDGSIMYIDTYATLRFFDDGNSFVVEYTAASPRRGKKLQEGESDTDILYNMACGGYNQVNSISDIFETHGVSFNISSDVNSKSVDENGNVEIYIDYCFEGIPVMFEKDGVGSHAVEMKFNSSGELIYFRQNVFDMSISGEEYEFPPVMNAINSISTLSGEGDPKRVRDIFKGFIVKDKKIDGVWCVRLQEDNTIFAVR